MSTGTSGSSSTATTTALISASSYHTGGVNVCFGDGSVRFVPETINARSSGAGGGRYIASGASTFGVWGALGSIDGGEATSL
jgi:prepilin-type processing-associated H-X9-DG protein